MTMIALLQNFQEALGPFFVPIVIALGILLFSITLIYFFGVFIHWRKRKFRKSLVESWRSALSSIEHRGGKGGSLEGDFGGRKSFSTDYRDDLVEVLEESDLESSRKVEIYRETGLYDRDRADLLGRTWWKKVQGINRLKRLSLSGLEGTLASLVYDQNHEVRINALDGLSYVDETPEMDPLRLFESFSEGLDSYLLIKLFSLKLGLDFLRPLALSEKERLRRAGATLLGQRGETDFLPLLEKLTEDNDSRVRSKAAESLGKIGVPETINQLSSTAEDPVPSVRKATARSLGEVQGERSLELLEQLADDENFGVKLAAFTSLSRFGESGREAIGTHWTEDRRLAREAVFESYQE